jgi:hypothetical protein
MQHIRDMFRKYQRVHPKVLRRNEVLRPEEYECPEEVKQTFHELTHSVTYTFHGHTIRFFYVDEDCDALVQLVARLIHVLQVKPVVADILLSSAKKFYPKNGIFGQSHLNTGYCTGDRVVVYRKEEWFKVLIHELFHYNEFDAPLRDANVATPIQTAYHLRHSIMLNEAYCEVSARVIQCCFISAMTNFPVKYLLEIERQHSIQNIVNMLHCMNMEYESFFETHSFREETNAFAYIVMGGLLMYQRFVPEYHKDTKFRIRHPEAFVQTLLKHCKEDALVQELSLLIPGVTTTMSILQIHDFSI